MKSSLRLSLYFVLAACGPSGMDPMQGQPQPATEQPTRKAQQGLECGVVKGTDGKWTSAQVTLQSSGVNDRTDLLLWFGLHPTNPLEGCARVEGVSFELWRCSNRGARDANPIDPGMIEVTSGAMHLATEGANDSASVPGLMRAGEDIAFNAAGHELPAFSGTVQAPGMPVLTEAPSMLRRGTELRLSWIGTDGARVRLGAGRTELWAVVPAGSSTVTLPASALDDLERGTSWVEVSGYRAREVTAGSAAVCLVAVQQPVYRTFVLAN